jgi:uncharacterized protein (DUF2336 family)
MDENKLNKQDVISLSRNTNIENKSTIARKISIYYNNSSISEQEAKLAEDIFRIMIRDTEIKVREVLADHLKYCNNIPQDIVKSIINDKDSIAVPFLQYYKSLTSEDLFKILEMPGINKHKAIAQRQNLSSPVTQYIATHCSDQVVGELVSNESANISESTFEIITNKYTENEDIKKRLVYRSELPVAVIEKIIDKLSYKLKTHLMLHHNLDKDIVSNLVEDIKEKITLSISEEYSNDRQIEELVHQLYKANKLTPGLVVRAICLGDLKFFEYAIVYLSETPIAEVRKILFNNKTDFMVRNLLRKAFIPKSVFPAIFSALKIISEIRFDCGRTNRKAFGHKVIERILTLNQNTNELTNEDINYLISKIN